MEMWSTLLKMFLIMLGLFVPTRPTIPSTAIAARARMCACVTPILFPHNFRQNKVLTCLSFGLIGEDSSRNTFYLISFNQEDQQDTVKVDNLLEVFFTNSLFETLEYIICGLTKLTTDEFFNRFRHVLKPLGLSEYEIRVFLTLVRNGPANYRVLGKKSNVPLGKIYQVLSTLEARGFIEIIHRKPKIYKAAEPKIALRRRLRQLEDNVFELAWKIREVLPTLQFQYGLRHDAIQGVIGEIFVGRNSFARSIQGNLLRALDEVLISTSEFDIKLHEEDLFKQLLEHGVTVKVLCSKVDENAKDVLDRLINLGVDIRVLDTLEDRYYVLDDKNVFTFIAKFGEEICLQIHGSALCRVLKDRFEETWKKARVMRQRMNARKNMNRVNPRYPTFCKLF